jgi:exo-beta-1,3-glucanase (GH17 family)/cellulose synthase/poly-beta-1,6-N-acetylglucosamine synthase-like glycosyltransferase
MKIAFALLTTCLATTALWAASNHPLDAPDWHERLAGISYSPSHLFSEDDLERGVPPERIAQDMRQLASLTSRIRTYTVGRGLDRVPEYAAEHGLTVSLGIWLGADRVGNEREISAAIDVIERHARIIDRVFVGNEVLLRGELSPPELAAYIARVKQATRHTRVKVGTADVWGVWLDAGPVVAESDFIGVHLLPYWEGIAADRAIDYLATRAMLLQHKFPGKEIVIAEAGWPSEGRVRRAAIPSPVMQSYFLRHFLHLAATHGYDYYVIEAFDQPWKADTEGAVGAFWGLLDARGVLKAQMTGQLTTLAEWRPLAAAASAALLLVGVMILRRLPAMRLGGYLLVAGIVAVIVNGGLLLGRNWWLPYMPLAEWPLGLLFAATFGFAAIVVLTECVEWASSLWRERYTIPALQRDSDHEVRRVSIHVPTHNEPPQMVVRTLNALARLDYPDFEVIVFDNNTSDPALWRPVEARCHALGPRFRFYHADGVTGFKGGALNRALAVTSEDVEYIAVIDSDYEVAPDWLTAVMPAFADPQVAVVQAPQDYRDSTENLFKSVCYEEYTTFFRVGMVERNEHNAIVQHGTMCVVRRDALQRVGGWAEWCITEDTELGLRLLEAGYRAVYTPVSFGRGLMPDTFAAYKSQRYRWAYGAMQMLRHHAPSLLSRRAGLTWAQRYHFIAGWLPWIADALASVFAIAALVWTMCMAIAPRLFDVPLTAFSTTAVALFVIKNVKTISVHCTKVGSGVIAAVAAGIVGVSLAATIGRAVIAGLFTSSQPFLRTPKCEANAPWTRALQFAAGELLMLTLFVAAVIVSVEVTGADDPADVARLGALLVFAIPYLCAVLVAAVSAFDLPPLQSTQPVSASLTEGDAESAA